MEKTINRSKVKEVLAERGWEQKDLASALDVSQQTITNWLKGTDFPRPKRLLSLATILQLSFNDLVTPEENEPVIAFRKKGASKTTVQHIEKAKTVGKLLKPLAKYIPKRQPLRCQITNPSMAYEDLQATAEEIRRRVGRGTLANLTYQDLIEQFHENGAVLVPVLWGKTHEHKNALHILLPDEKLTFIFINLDTKIEDFKFWMAHELAHVFTPDLAGKDEGEDYADALAGALLFPQKVAEKAYAETTEQKNATKEKDILKKYADKNEISLFSVFSEINKFAKAKKLPLLRSTDKSIHQLRIMRSKNLISQMLFEPLPPEPAAYIAATKHTFQSSFFDGLRAMIKDRDVGSSYISQIMDISLHDAITLYNELSH